MSRFDRLRSLVRQVGDRAQERLERGPLAAARELVREIADRKARIPEGMLARALAHGQGVDSVSVACSGGRIRIDATFSDGGHVMVGLVPHDIRFAARGAKEVVFRVEPPEVARDHRVTELIACVAAAIAHGIWAVGLQGASVDARGVFVDKEADDLFRVDLRTVPAVRTLTTAGPVGAVVEALSISDIRPEDGSLTMQLELPALSGM